MITIGSDVHLKTSTMTVLDHDGSKLAHKKIDNNPEELIAFIRQFKGTKQFAMESSYNWPAMYELVKNEVDEFHLIHSKKLKAIVDSQSKCDSHDASEIAHLTHIGYIPRAYIANADTRQFRHLLRTRVSILLLITRLKNKIHALINANTLYGQRPQNFKDLFCKRGIRYLQELPIPERERFIVDKLLEEISNLEQLKAEFDTYIKSIDFHSEDMSFLRSVPAMKGNLICHIVLSEIDTVNRFKNSHSLVAYAGLIPRDASSGSKNRKGRLRTDCNQFLKWAMIEAVPSAVRHDKALYEYYCSVKQRTNSSSARLAIARRLLTAIYHVLKERRPYYSNEQKPSIALRRPLPSSCELVMGTK